MRFFGYIYISEKITIYIFPRHSITYARCLLTVYGVYKILGSDKILYSWQVGAGVRSATT